MKTPTWGYVIGILMMLFGGCSITKNLQSINTPAILEMQKNMFKGMSDSFKTTKTDSLNVENIDSNLTKTIAVDPSQMINNMSETMETMFYMSNSTITWIVRFGYIGLIVSFIYILAGVFLLIRKSFSLKLAYAALGLSILFNVIQSIVLSNESSNSFIAIAAGFSNLFGIMVDIILIVVILASNKTMYGKSIE